MSNAQVGNVYSQIIGDVIESSRVDFEEGGVDEAVLEELKTVRRFSAAASGPHLLPQARDGTYLRYTYTRIVEIKQNPLSLCRG
jgi:hypothetical protein